MLVERCKAASAHPLPASRAGSRPAAPAPARHPAPQVVRAPLPKRALTTFVAGRSLTGDGMIVRGAGSNSAKIVEPNVQCGVGLAHTIDGVLTFLSIPGLGH